MISITLPSLYERSCARTLRNIRDATRSKYEIILVSPFPPPTDDLSNITWIEEKPGTGTGCNAGHAAAWPHTEGDFITPWVDDHYYADGWDVIALENYDRRECDFHVEAPGKPFVLGLRHSWPHHVGTQFGLYYPYFPFLRREYVEEIGWFDAKYLKGFADGDLALRVWQAGGRCEWSDSALIVVDQADDNRKAGVMYEQSDMDLFVERWGVVYGEGWATGHIRDFNIDIEPYVFPQFNSGNTVIQNRNLEFRSTLINGGWRP